jgi:ribonuclease HI
MMEVYTDGGCSGNPGPGGWAYVIIDRDINLYGSTYGDDVVPFSAAPLENWGAERSTTNNRMELQAVIAALQYIRGAGKVPEISIHTDSQYVQKGITEWIKEWKSRGWKTSAKKPVKNQDLWQRLDTLSAGLSITWVWVKGHAGNKYNERCDLLTQKAIASL